MKTNLVKFSKEICPKYICRVRGEPKKINLTQLSGKNLFVVYFQLKNLHMTFLLLLKKLFKKRKRKKEYSQLPLSQNNLIQGKIEQYGIPTLQQHFPILLFS